MRPTNLLRWETMLVAVLIVEFIVFSAISPFWQMFINGAVILVAVLISARGRTVARPALGARA